MDSKGSSRKFRYWPLYSLAFIKSFYWAIYSIALPNILVYFQDISSIFIGIINSAFSLAYVLGPFLGLKLSKHLNTKHAIFISILTSNVMLLLQVLFFTPSVLLFACILDGLGTGLFWPNLQVELSNWQKTFRTESSSTYVKNYSLSWSGGLLFGFVAGLLLSFWARNDFLPLNISFLISLLMLGIIAYFESGTEGIYSSKGVLYVNTSIHPTPSILPEDSLSLDSDDVSSSLGKAALIPFSLVLLSGIYFAHAKTVYNFTLPFIFESENIASYFVYLIILIQQTLQVIFMNWSANFPPFWKVRATQITIAINLVLTLWVFIFQAIWVFLLAAFFSGVFYGVIYTVNTQIMLEKGGNTTDAKYSSYYEVAIGIGFGITPIIAGLLMDINFFTIFLVHCVLSIPFLWRWLKPFGKN